nr:MAG TPA: hypothetical protein [Caudoviricetes sp.]
MTQENKKDSLPEPSPFFPNVYVSVRKIPVIPHFRGSCPYC